METCGKRGEQEQEHCREGNKRINTGRSCTYVIEWKRKENGGSIREIKDGKHEP